MNLCSAHTFVLYPLLHLPNLDLIVPTWVYSLEQISYFPLIHLIIELTHIPPSIQITILLMVAYFPIQRPHPLDCVIEQIIYFPLIHLNIKLTHIPPSIQVIIQPKVP